MKTNKLVIIFTLIILLISISNLVYADEQNKEITKKVLQSDEKQFLEELENEIELEDGKYTLINSNKIETSSENYKKETYTTDIKLLNTNNEDELKEIFDKKYDYKDEKYKGTLYLKDFNIETINNGYEEYVDTEIENIFNISSNDLYDVSKEKTINGRVYTLVNVDWQVIETENVDNTTVPTKYDGIATYQTIIRTYNSDSYNVSANYEGEVERIDKIYEYILTYQKEYTFPVISVVLIGAGVFAIAILLILNFNNATIYNITEEQKRVKIKSFRVKPNMILLINSSKTKTNNYILEIKETRLTSMIDKRITIKINGSSISLLITKAKTSFQVY